MAKDKASGGGGNSAASSKGAPVNSGAGKTGGGKTGSAQKAASNGSAQKASSNSGSRNWTVTGYDWNPKTGRMEKTTDAVIVRNADGSTRQVSGYGWEPVSGSGQKAGQGGGQSQQFAQEASQGQQAQEQKQEQNQFSAEANEGKQGKDQKQDDSQRYTREANQDTQQAGYTPEGNYYDPEADADFVDLFARDEAGKTGKEQNPLTAQATNPGENPDARKGQAWARQQETAAKEQLGQLQADRLRAQQIKEAGGDLKTAGLRDPAEYDRDIEQAEWLSGYYGKLAEQVNSDAERDALTEQYNPLAEQFETYSGYATDPMTAAWFDTLENDVEGLESQLKGKNRELGNEVYSGLADWARPKDFMENWQGERGAQYSAALGTAAEWLGDKINNTSYVVTDPETGEEREAWNLAGKGDGLQEWGANVFQNAREQNAEAQRDWEDVTEGMSDTGKQALGYTKMFGNTAEDAVVNFLTLGVGGKVLMGARAGGAGALEQDSRENNDLDSRAAKMFLDGGVAVLSEYMVGGAEGAYGKSVFGRALSDFIGKGISNPVTRRILFNTEGLEEGLEYGLTLLGDKLLGLDPNAEWSWGEFAQNVAVGHMMGCVFNGISTGQEIDPKKMDSITTESARIAQGVASGEIDLPSLMEETMNTPGEVTIKPGKADAEAETGAAGTETNAPETEQSGETPAGQGQTPETGTTARAVQPETDSTGVAWTGDWDSWVDTVLSGGAISDTDVDTIYNRPDARRAFEERTGISLDGMTEEDAKATIGMAAGTTTRVEPQSQSGTGQEAGPNAEAPTVEENAQAPQNLPPQTGAAAPETGASPAAAPNPAEILADTATGQSPGTPMETPQNVPESNPGQNGGNTPESPQNVAEGGLNRTETNEGSNPLADTVIGENRNDGRQTLTEESGEEKVSQYYSNTMTKTGEAADVEPISYKVKSESESVANAAARLKKDYQGMVNYLMEAEAWSGEMVDMSDQIAQELRKDARRTGDNTAWQDWKRIQSAKIRESARGLQAVAKQSRPGSDSVLTAMTKEFDAIREANAKAEKEGRTKDIIPEKVLKQAEEKANKVCNEMLDLEIEVDDKVDAGMSEADALDSVKERYLDLIDEINTFRHTGLFQDIGKHANARSDAKARKQVQNLNTKFRQMLSGESMDYIMRFAACDAAGISEDVHYKGRQDFLKRLNTWQKLAQLTGTGTWLRNGVGNGSFGLVDVLAADNPVTVLADGLMSLKTGKRSSGVETGILNRNARDAAAHALNRSILEVAANIDLSGDSDSTKYDMSRTRTYDPASEKALERITSRWEQWNGYMLQSSDAWFKGMAEGSAESAIRKANRWGDDNLTDTERSRMKPEDAQKLTQKRQAELDEVKEQIAEYRTFQNNGENGVTAKYANKIRDGLNNIGADILGKEWQNGQFGLGTALMPYVTVPTNLAVKSLEFSPLGAVKGVAEMVQVLSDPKATMAQQNKAVTDFGRGATGTMLIFGLAQLMKQVKWFKDWDNEDDKDVKAQNKAEGKSGMQLNLDMIHRWANGDKSGEWRNGDRTLDISSMEPLNQLITTASLIAEHEDPGPGDIGKAMLASARDSTLNMPAMQTLSNIENSIRYTDTPEEGWKTFFNTVATTTGNVASGLVPNPLKHVAAVTDENVRDTSGNNPLERTVNTVKNSVPFLRQTLPVKTDAYGNEQKAGDFATRFANQYDAFKHNQVNQSDVSREVERIREATGESHTPARNGPKSITFGTGADKVKVEQSAEERKEYRDESGRDFNQAMRDLLNNPVYQLADDATKEQMMAEAESYVQDTAKMGVAEEHDIEYDSKYADIRELSDPVAVLAAQTQLKIAEKAEDWDAVDALLQTTLGKANGGEGGLSQEGMDYLREKDSDIGYYDYLQGWGVPIERAKAFESDLKMMYTREHRTDARGSDYIRVAGSGRYSRQEADAIMAYASEVSQKSVEGYQDRILYQLGEAHMGNLKQDVYDRVEKIQNGEMTTDDFRTWVRKEMPLKQANEIADIVSTWVKDRHAAGKQVAGLYTAARQMGMSPEEALAFYQTIDTNFNGSYAKGEINDAIAAKYGYVKKTRKKAFGNVYYWYDFTPQGQRMRDLITMYAGK